MRWIFRIIFLLMLLFFIGWGYFSYIRAKHYSIIVRSPLQGTKILSPGEWGIYPERLIPRYVRIEPLPSSLQIYGQVKVMLPFHSLLKNIENYEIIATYTLKRPLTPAEQKDLVEQGESSLQKFWETKISALIQEYLNTAVQQDNLSQNSAKAGLENHLSTISGLEVQFSTFPDMLEYYKLKKQILETLDKDKLAAQESLIEITAAQEQKKLALRKETIKQAIDFSVEQSKVISDANADPTSTFSILELLLEPKSAIQINSQLPAKQTTNSSLEK